MNNLLFIRIKRLLVLLIVSLYSQSLIGQTTVNSAVVTGVVTDKNDEPLAGVSVTIVGTNKGTVTNTDGYYSIAIGNKDVLKFSYMGFVDQTQSVNNRRSINVLLIENLTSLEEIVVVGYGVQQKSHLTGSITKVKTEGIVDIPTPRLDQALQGRIAGVQIQNTTSEVGANPEIKVRGTASFSAKGSPLIVVDGFPIADGLESVNPGDVESIEVLKDAASSAIYGSRAANGVIMITTKAGTPNKPQYAIKVASGIKDPSKLHPIMSSREYIDMRVRDANLTNTLLSNAEFPFATIDNNTDWQREALRNAAIFNNAEFSIRGGSKEVKYFMSGAYNDDQGMMIKNFYKRINVRGRIDADLSKKVSIGLNIAPSYTESERPNVGFMDYVRTPSWVPVKHTAQTAAITGQEEGSYAYGAQFNSKSYTGIDPQTGLERTVVASPWGSANHNPRSITDNVFAPQKQYRMQMSGYFNMKILKQLTFRSSNSININYAETDQYRNREAIRDGETNRGYYTSNNRANLATENTLTFTNRFNKVHNINALLGASLYKNNNKRVGVLGLDFPTDYIHYISAAGRIDQYEGEIIRTGTWFEDDAMASFFGRLNYDFKDRYLLSVSLRTDGSSKFGKDNKWGWFPSISAGWRISEESFFKNNATWIDQLKLRASYGVTGTDAITNYANIDQLSIANYPLGTGNGTIVSGSANNSTTLGNSALRWEQTGAYNLGLDFYTFKNRIGITFDYYYSITKSLLYEKTINSISGYTRAWTNEGKLRNHGFELELSTYNIKTKKISWNTSFNISATRNKLLDLAGPQEQISIGSYFDYYIARVGSPLIQYFGWKAIGVWKDQAEIDNNPHHNNDRPGGLKVEDVNKDGKIDDEDKIPLGDPYPDFTWGVTNQISYKAFDLMFTFQGEIGTTIFNGDNTYIDLRKWHEKYIEGRWLSPEHPGNGVTPYLDNGLRHAETSYSLENASFVTLRSVTLGYKLPKKIVSKWRLGDVRIYSSIQNLFHLWNDNKYKGINPEARQIGGLYTGALTKGALQRGAFPIQRTVSFGLNVNF